MELKKLALTLLAALTITASAFAYAAFPASGSEGTIEKITVPTTDGDTSPQWRKCPPFC